MATFDPAYRLTVYADDDITPLVPRPGSPHADPFRVATIQGGAVPGNDRDHRARRTARMMRPRSAILRGHGTEI